MVIACACHRHLSLDVVYLFKAVRGTLSRSATLHQTITSTWAYVKQSLRQSMALSADNLDDLAYDTDPAPRVSALPISDTVARENPTSDIVARENPTSDNVAKENLTSNTGVRENPSYDTSKTPSDTSEVAAEADDEACTLLDMAIPAPEDGKTSSCQFTTDATRLLILSHTLSHVL